MVSGSRTGRRNQYDIKQKIWHSVNNADELENKNDYAWRETAMTRYLFYQLGWFIKYLIEIIEISFLATIATGN